jgi:hypothetical protein
MQARAILEAAVSVQAEGSPCARRSWSPSSAPVAELAEQRHRIEATVEAVFRETATGPPSSSGR